jgi:hypothetical protein
MSQPLADELIAHGTDPTLAAFVAVEPLFQQAVAQMRDPEKLRDLEAKRRDWRRSGGGENWGLSMQIRAPAGNRDG